MSNSALITYTFLFLKYIERYWDSGGYIITGNIIDNVHDENLNKTNVLLLTNFFFLIKLI